jgi:hypothetical protein
MNLKVILILFILLLGFICTVKPSYSYERESGTSASENLGSIALESPYFKTVNVYKGQLHCHSTNSDGAQSPLEVVEAYKSAGYNFMAITDHNYVTHNPMVGGILFISGNEVTSNLGHITTTNVPGVPPSRDAQTIVDWTKMQGGLVWLAHPNFDPVNWTTEEMASIKRYNGIEVYNHVSNSYTEDKWDYALTYLNRNITAIAVDDCHNVTKPSRFNGGWVMVFANSLSKTNILDSLEKGNFYSTQGPIINAVEVKGNTISIRLKQTSKIVWIGAGGSILRETADVTGDSYVARGNEKYVRIRVESSGYAWTNPIYVPRLVVHSATVSDLRVNPSQIITVSGQVNFKGTNIPPAGGGAVQAYINLNGENKAAINITKADGSFTFPSFPAESSVGLYNYYVYTVCGDKVSIQNQTVLVIVDGLKVSNYTINITNDQVQVCLLYAYDDTIVQKGNVTYAGLFALTNETGWLTFNLSPLSAVEWDSTAYAISEPTYGLTAKLQNQTIGYTKTKIAAMTIKANNQIFDATWNFWEGKLSFSSSGTNYINVSYLGKPTSIEVDGATYSDWTYNSTARQVVIHNLHGRVVLQWSSYVAELWTVAAFFVGLTIVTAVLLKMRGNASFLTKHRPKHF